jgi:hypothetical protein
MGEVVAFGGMVVQHIIPYFIKNVPISGTYGYHPPSITSPLKGKTKVQVVEDHIGNQQEVLKLWKDNLFMAQNRMKQQVDQHHSEKEFEVGHWVFLRL